MIELLRLADSRVAMAGGLVTDTPCVGTLVVFSMSPALFADKKGSENISV